MIQHTLNFIKRVRVGTSGIDEDAQLLAFGWRDSAVTAGSPLVHVPAGRHDLSKPPTTAELDKVADEAMARQDRGEPWTCVRIPNVTLTDCATPDQVGRMRRTVLRCGCFPPRQLLTTGKDGDKEAHFAMAKDVVGPAKALPPVLQVPVIGTWHLRAADSVRTDKKWHGATGAKLDGEGTEAGRAVDEIRVGDRFVQRALAMPYGPIFSSLSILSSDEVTHVYDDAASTSTGAVASDTGAVGFTVATTANHDEVGAHTAVLRWKPSDASTPFNPRYHVSLDVVSATTYHPHVSKNPLALGLARTLTRRAHELSKDQIRIAGGAPPPRPDEGGAP